MPLKLLLFLSTVVCMSINMLNMRNTTKDVSMARVLQLSSNQFQHHKVLYKSSSIILSLNIIVFNKPYL